MTKREKNMISNKDFKDDIITLSSYLENLSFFITNNYFFRSYKFGSSAKQFYYIALTSKTVTKQCIESFSQAIEHMPSVLGSQIAEVAEWNPTDGDFFSKTT